MRRCWLLSLGCAGASLAETLQTFESHDPIGLRDLPPETGREWDHMTGDWAGHRQRLVDRGIHFQAGYLAEVWGNLSGGLRTGAVYQGLAELGLDLDLERLSGWTGARFRAAAIYPHGEGPSQELTGDSLGVSNIEAFRHDPGFYELWLEQRFARQQLSLRGGLLLADTEFAITEAAAPFLNSAFGWPSAISLNTLNTGPAFFRPALGVRIRYEPTPHWMFHAGVFDGDTFDGDPEHDDALDQRLGGGDGLFSIAEIGFRWDSLTGVDARPGEIRVGGWLHTADFFNPLYPDEDPGRMGGVFWSIEQTVWWEDPAGDSSRRVSIFARSGWSPPERSVAEWSGEAGLTWEGPLFRGMEQSIGIGVAWAQLSENFRKALAAAADESACSAEVALEITWNLALTPWWTIQPDYQWVHFVGGSGLHDAHVIALRSGLSF